VRKSEEKRESIRYKEANNIAPKSKIEPRAHYAPSPHGAERLQWRITAAN